MTNQVKMLDLTELAFEQDSNPHKYKSYRAWLISKLYDEKLIAFRFYLAYAGDKSAFIIYNNDPRLPKERAAELQSFLNNNIDATLDAVKGMLKIKKRKNIAKG